MPWTMVASGALWEEGLFMGKRRGRENAGPRQRSGPVGEEGAAEQSEAGWGHRLQGEF